MQELPGLPELRQVLPELRQVLPGLRQVLPGLPVPERAPLS